MMMIKNTLPIVLLFLMGLLWGDMVFAEAPKMQVSVNAINATTWPAQYKITLTVPKDHHAYLDKGTENIYIPVAFDTDAKLAASGLSVSKLEKPAGVYDAEVKATVLRDKGDFTLSLTPIGKGVSLPNIGVAIQYQLCNDATHVCFRPQHTQAELSLPAAEDESLSFTDKLLSLFQNNKDSTFILFGLMLIAGLLSVATPCVYPMLPITSMFIVNRAQGHKDKEKHHAGAYMVGMVGTYMVLGLLAGMTGGAFNTFMQSATVNLVFAVFFAFFAVALLGFYELSFMQNEVHTLDQKTTRVNGLGGTWLMGTVAGLVISPCVGPIVFALLLQVADNIAAKSDALALVNQSMGFWDKLLVASQGGFMMGGFGLDFFIKNITLNMAIWIAVVHCHVLSLLPRDAMPNEKMHHYCGVVSLLIGGWLVSSGMGSLPFVGNAGASGLLASAASPIVATANSAQAIHEEAGIKWYRNIAEAQKVAQQTGKPIFIDFYASWCANCTAFKEETVSNESLNHALRESAIAVKLIDKEPDFEKFRDNPEHRQLKIGLPYFAILSPDGKVTWSGTDYKATEKMVSVLDNGAV